MSKAVINYHCTNPKSTKAAETELVIFDHEHRVYHKTTKSADIIRVDLKSPGDLRMKFSNPSVSWIHLLGLNSTETSYSLLCDQ